jgi:hypothetical protein
MCPSRPPAHPHPTPNYVERGHLDKGDMRRLESSWAHVVSVQCGKPIFNTLGMLWIVP